MFFSPVVRLVTHVQFHAYFISILSLDGQSVFIVEDKFLARSNMVNFSYKKKLHALFLFTRSWIVWNPFSS